MSKIQWTDATWNPLAGCSIVSPGCARCYAMRQAHRLEHNFKQTKYAGTTTKVNGKPIWTGKVNLDEAALQIPLKRRRPTRYFVNSMSDLFHEAVPDQIIDRVCAVMALCPQHTFQVLTKRAERMCLYMTVARQAHPSFMDQTSPCSTEDCVDAERDNVIIPYGHMGDDPSNLVRLKPMPWPLPNVWLGVSVEDQKRADERIPWLLKTPAEVRFVSAEPLLGPIDLQGVPCNQNHPEDYSTRLGALLKDAHGVGIHWVIIGGESGPGARRCDLNWIRSLVRQCRAAGVPAFVKQVGAKPILGCPPGEEKEEQFREDGSARYWTLGMIKDPKGGDMSEWPADLRAREWPR